MHHVLDAVHGNRAGHSTHVEQAFDAQHILSVRLKQHAEPYSKSRPIDRLIECQAKSMNTLVVPIAVVMVMRVLKCLGIDPMGNLFGFRFGVVQIVGQQLGRG